jgi:hypothetical protein
MMMRLVKRFLIFATVLMGVPALGEAYRRTKLSTRIAATIALEMMGPMPGTVISRSQGSRRSYAGKWVMTA